MRLLSMSGLVPEHVCDVERFCGWSSKRSIGHYCGYADQFISRVMDDDSIDGAVFPRSCDSTRVIGSYLDDAGKFWHRIHVPARDDEPAVSYLASEIEALRNHICEHFDVEIDDVEERCELLNRRNEQLRGVVGSMGSRSFEGHLRNVHAMLARPLAEQVVTNPEAENDRDGARVWVTGSFLADLSVAGAIDECGLSVVGDSLPESGRLASTPTVEVEDNVWEAIARGMLGTTPSPTRDGFAKLIDHDADRMRELGVQGVLYVTQKYCEPYDFMYPAYQRAMDASGIPVLRLQLTGDGDAGKAALAIGAFADML